MKREKSAMDTSIYKKARDWALSPLLDESSRKEIQNLLDNGEEQELNERFYKDLEFGTGGMRGLMGAGLNRINKYTVGKAVQALSEELLALGENDLKAIIAYDSRHLSKELANEAACIFAGNGIHGHLFQGPVPLPLLSFTIRHTKAQAGIMITASHNPPEYNGIKILWSHGGQVTPPFDRKITDRYLKQKDFSNINSLDLDKGLSKGLIQIMGKDVEIGLS